jgi:hypothetical protein
MAAIAGVVDARVLGGVDQLAELRLVDPAVGEDSSLTLVITEVEGTCCQSAGI